MRRIQNFNKMPVATIKAKRNKVLQVISKEEPLNYIVKIMSVSNNNEFLWFEKEIGDRLDVLKRISNAGIIDIIQRGLFEVEVKETEREKVVYLTRREIIGPTLLKILERENLAVEILMLKNIKQLIWSIMALIIGGGGYGGLIITLENIIFEEIGDTYRPVLNYFSFIGNPLLKFRRDIEKEEFLEIAMFLDQQALESGQLDRFEFKARNFALLIISLLFRRNPAIYIFQSIEVPNSVSLEKAKELYQKVVRPRLKQLLTFKSLKNAFNLLKIQGLEDFIRSALSFQSAQKGPKDWAMIQNILLENTEKPSQGSFNRIPRLLWEDEQNWVKEMLNKKGMGMGENGDKIYMAFKISTQLECLLQYNDWKSMMKKLEYSYKTHDMFYRLLKCTTLKDSKVLQQTTLELLQVSKESFKKIGQINNRDVYTHTHQHEILNQYMNII